MKRIFTIFVLFIIFLHYPAISYAEEKSFEFLPSRTLFAPLLADNREPQTSFTLLTDKDQTVGTIGKSLDLLQWKLSQYRGRMSWGITGAAFALLDYGGGSFPMRANDWQFGTYLSHAKNGFSQKLEFTHSSTHLGDALFSERNPFVYSREYVRWIFAYEKKDFIKFYGGGGGVIHIIPDDDPLFLQAGSEIYSKTRGFFSELVRFYGAYDLKYKQEAGGVLNHSLQVGIQLLPHSKKTRSSVRIGLSYFDGNHEFGQFYKEKESHWGLGIFFDS